MPWSLEFDPRVEKDLRRIDRVAQRRILAFLSERVAASDNPRLLGKALEGRFSGLWRYRVGDHRVICRIEDTRLIILVIEIGHRSEVYR